MQLPAAGRDVDPADPVRIVAIAPASEPCRGVGRTLGTQRQRVAALGLAQKLGGEKFERRGQSVERFGKIRPAQRFGTRRLARRLAGCKPEPA